MFLRSVAVFLGERPAEPGREQPKVVVVLGRGVSVTRCRRPRCRSVRLATRRWLAGEQSMMIDARSNDVARLRREWVAAYGAWTQVADDKALSSSGLTAVQRAALRRYRAAESAYFARLHATTDSELRT
jgi:hypothetical protein